MNITFVFEDLFPGTTRAARHVEALARRFQVKGHRVSVITTSLKGEKDPEELGVLRLAHAPSRATAKDTNLRLKSIVKHLKQEASEVVFAESLTPLASLAVKAAGESHIPAIVRVLEDRNEIVHDFAQGPRTSARVIKKKIAALLEHATVVAASSTRCGDLLKDDFNGPIHVIEKCVDLNVFRHGRTTRRDLETFLTRFNARGRRILLYARENPRESTPQEVFALLGRLREFAGDALFMIVGDVKEETLLGNLEDDGLRDMVRCTGALEGRDFFAAYEAAAVFLIPPASQASGREILEAMAMGCAVACYPVTASASSGVVVPDRTAIVLDKDDPEAAARMLGQLLQDEERLASFQENAVEIARQHDLDVAIDQVEKLAVEVLGFTTAKGQTDQVTVAGEEPTKMAGEVNKDEGKGNGRSGSSSRGRGRRRKSSETPDPEPVASDVPESEEVEAPAAASSANGDDTYDGVTMVGDKEPPARRSRSRRRGKGRSQREEEVEELGASTGIDVLDVPAGRAKRRDWGPQPGLTLKDLMPFLRPPRNVVILGLSTGAGHARVAAAVTEAFKGVDRNLVVRQTDMIDLIGKLYLPPFVRTKLDELARNPALFGTAFETVSARTEAELPADLDEFLAKVFGEKMDALVVDKRPDMVICTHWLPFRYLQRLKEEERLSTDVVAVVADPVCHDLWLSEVVSHYVVPDDAHRTWLSTHGVDMADVSVSGMPVSAACSEKADREAVLKELDLKGQNPVVLLRPEGVGTPARAQAMVQRILARQMPMDLLVLEEKNDRLREGIEGLELPEECTIRTFGSGANVMNLVRASDVVITRTNPHTVAETLAVGTPVVLLRPAPGMEERLADRLLESGLAVKAYGEDDLEVVLTDLFKNRRLLQKMRDASRAHGRGNAAAVAVERLATLVR